MKELYLWLDLETTGLEPRFHIPIEISAIVTEPGRPYDSLFEYHAVLESVPNDWDELDPTVYSMHTKSGLKHESLDSEVMCVTVDKDLSEIMDNFQAQFCLSGSSVHFDREFLSFFFPEVFRRLHHRQCDISSVIRWIHAYTGTDPLEEESFRNLFGFVSANPYEAATHRAEADIIRSIDLGETLLKWMRDD